MQNLVDFFFELGQLKRAKRSGWWLINVKNPESVAEHSFRAAAVGYMLAKMENADADKVMKICLFNDIHEARLNDLHKVGHRYINFRKAEKKAFEEQMQRLPAGIGEEMKKLFAEMQDDSSKEGTVAKDADLLECAFQAKEYIDIGHKEAQDWLDNIKVVVKTESARKMLREIEKSSSNRWWHGLKNAER